MSKSKFVMQITVAGNTKEYVSHRAKSLSAALIEFGRQITDVGIDSGVSVTIGVSGQALRFTPPHFVLEHTRSAKTGHQGCDPLLKPLDRNHPGYTRTIMLLVGRLSMDPQFADLTDTRAYQDALRLPEGIVGGLDMDTLTHPREVMERFEQLHDLIQRFVTERQITRFTPPDRSHP